MSISLEQFFLEKCSTLLSQMRDLEPVSIINDHNNHSNQINLWYGREGNRSSFIMEYTPRCLEVYGAEEVPQELVNALSQSLPTAKHQQYNPRTHYWSGKAIDDYFLPFSLLL